MKARRLEASQADLWRNIAMTLVIRAGDCFSFALPMALEKPKDLQGAQKAGENDGYYGQDL